MGLFDSKPKSPTRTPDSLFSNDFAEAIIGVSEGQIVGLENGANSFYIGDTPLVSVDGNPNFTDFLLTVHKGVSTPDSIKPLLGGFTSSINVGSNLETNVPITRTGTHQNIDFIDVRIVFQQLYTQNDNGTFQNSVTFKIEYKQTSSTTWLAAFPGEPLPGASTSGGIQALQTTAFERYEGQAGDTFQYAWYDVQTFWQTAAPTTGEDGAYWFDKDDNNKPHYRVGGAWVLPTNLTLVAASGTTPTYWTWLQDGKERRAYFNTTYVPADAATQWHFWLTNLGVTVGDDSVYVFNGSSWVKGRSWTQGYSSPAPGQIKITGKTTTPYVKEFRIPVPNVADTIDVRVTKLTPANTTTSFSDIQWESLQEGVARTFTFPNLAVAQVLVRASDQFANLPDFSGIYKGIVCNVPSNYDPLTKVHTGIWNGVWKREWTDNPAYIVNDLVNNDRYGLNAYYPVVLDKWSVYEFGVHCDAHGITFNGLLSDPRSCREAIDYICGIAGGRFTDDGNGTARILIDNDKAAVAIFTPENVADGVFSYSMSDLASRHNDITVTFTNPTLNWQEDRRRVYDQNHINQYGRIPYNFSAVGCTNATEAIKRAKYHLVSSLTEVLMVNFKTNRVGLYLEPYDIILVADETSSFGLHGRIKEQTSTTELVLRDAVYLEDGISYKISFSLPEGTLAAYQIVEADIVNPGGGVSVTTITTTTALPTLPEAAVFSLTGAGSMAGTPKAYRVVTIEESDGDPDNITISAVEHNRQKWDYVDGIITDPDIIVTDHSTAIQPPTNLRLSIYDVDVMGMIQQNALFEWDRSVSAMARKYRVYTQFNQSEVFLFTETTGTSAEVPNLRPGNYLFGVSAVSIDGVESTKIWLEHTIVGSERSVAPPTNLRLVGEDNPFVFTTKTPTFAWDASVDAFASTYKVSIFQPGTSTVLYEAFVNETTWMIEYSILETIGLPRTFIVGVQTVDQFNFLSQFIELEVSNPAPAPPASISYETGYYTCAITVPRGIERDWQGMRVWLSPTAGFTPNDTTLKYEGPQTQYNFGLVENEHAYIRIAFYDDYKPADVITSAQFDVVGTGLRPNSVSLDDLEESLQDKVQNTQLGDLRQLIQQEAANRLEAHSTEWNTIQEVDTISSTNDRQHIERYLSLSAQFNKAQAQIQRLDYVLTDQVRSLATDMLVLKTSYDNVVSAQISVLNSAVSDAVSALSLQITELTATFGQELITVKQEISAGVAPDGLVGKYFVTMTPTLSGTKYWSGFGLITKELSNNTIESSFIISVDNFLIGHPSVDGGAPEYVFGIGKVGGVTSVGIKGNMVVDGSIKAEKLDVNALSAITANVGEVTAGIIRSEDGKFVIDLNNKSFTIYS